MAKYDYLQPLVAQLGLTKEKRDFFVHRFLFHRYGGELMTSESDYEGLIQEAVELGKMFAAAHTSLHDFMFAEAPLVLFAAKRDPDSGELKFIESEYLLRQTTGGPSREPHQ